MITGYNRVEGVSSSPEIPNVTIRNFFHRRTRMACAAQVAVRMKDRREKDRNELRDLVGKNLLVLSQLEGVDLRLYQKTVLPWVLEQVVNCKDSIAQAYLMDAIIQVSRIH